MSRIITEVSSNGRTYYISYSDLDIEGESDNLYWDSNPNSSYHKLPSNYILRSGEIIDYWTRKRVSKYDIAEYISSVYR